MARLFKRTLSGHIRIYNRRVHNHVTELVAKEGVADFVLSPSSLNGERLEWVTKLASCITRPSAAAVAASLSVRRSASVQDIATKCGLSRKSVLSALRRMVEDGVARGDSGAGFHLVRPIRETDIELWAYELKLKNWRRGMYQALQYRAFAHSVAIVVPSEATKAINSKLRQFRAYRIGVLTFNARTGEIRVLVRPGMSHPKSLEHYLYALSAFIKGLPWHPAYKGPPHSPILPPQRRRASRPASARSRPRPPLIVRRVGKTQVP